MVQEWMICGWTLMLTLATYDAASSLRADLKRFSRLCWIRNERLTRRWTGKRVQRALHSQDLDDWFIVAAPVNSIVRPLLDMETDVMMII